MIVKTQLVEDANIYTLTERVAASLELLLNSGRQIISVTTVAASVVWVTVIYYTDLEKSNNGKKTVMTHIRES